MENLFKSKLLVAIACFGLIMSVCFAINSLGGGCEGKTTVNLDPSDVTVTTEENIRFNQGGDSTTSAPEYTGPEAKYVIMVIGDGMQLEHERAGSQYLYGSPDSLSWHRLTYKCNMTTWDSTTYGRAAWAKGEKEYNKDDFMPGIGYSVFFGGVQPYDLTPDLGAVQMGNSGFTYGQEAYFLSRYVAFGETDFDLDCSPSDYKKKFYLCTDSAAAGTAFSCGLKTEAGNIAWAAGGKDGFVYGKSTEDGDPMDGAFTTICERFRDQKGAAFGTLSSVPFNHATPAAFVSHNPDRNNYYTGRRSWYKGIGLCEDICYGTTPDVVIGGGYPSDPSANESSWGSGYVSYGVYNDIVNGNTEYVYAGTGLSIPNYASIDNAADAIVAGTAARNKLWSTWESSNWDGPYAIGDGGTVSFARDSAGTNMFGTTDPLVDDDPMIGGIPSLEHATVKALDVLKKNGGSNGFFVMVEQGDIDWANHANDYAWMVGTVWEMHKTVDAIVRYVEQDADMNWDNTLLVVTTDHGNNYMRLARDASGHIVLGKGELPTQTATGAGTGGGQYPYEGSFSYDASEVTISSDYHTNELVRVYAKGAGAAAIEMYEGLWYPGTRIIDNTQLHHAMAKAAYIDLSDIGQ